MFEQVQELPSKLQELYDKYPDYVKGIDYKRKIFNMPVAGFKNVGNKDQIVKEIMDIKLNMRSWTIKTVDK